MHINPTTKQNTKIKVRMRGSKFLKVTFASYGAIVMSLGGWMLWHYHQTQSWTAASMDGTLSTTAPEFVKNTYPVGMVSSVNKLNHIDKMLDKIDDDGGVNKSTLKQAQLSYQASKNILNKYHVTGGQAYQNQTKLGLYIAVYQIQQTAYQNPNPKQVSNLLGQMINQSLLSGSETDKDLVKQLNKINRDYQHLNQFLSEYLVMLGRQSGDKVVMSLSVNGDTIKTVMSKIDQWHLRRFNNINQLYIILNGSQVSHILSNNQTYFDEKQWKQIEKLYHTLSQNQYLGTDDLNTLSDAKDAKLLIKQPNQKDGYSISDSSPIDTISVDGQIIKSGQYVKKNAKIQVSIDPVYKPSNQASKAATKSKAAMTSSSSDANNSSSATRASSSSGQSSDDEFNDTAIN